MIHKHLEIAGRVADMTHDAPFGARQFNSFDRSLERFDAVLANNSARGLASFSAQDNVLILRDGARGRVRIGVLYVGGFTDEEILRARSQRY